MIKVTITTFHFHHCADYETADESEVPFSAAAAAPWF